jgi:DNA polymerase III sliding clamp (beta) subunit (PCNA family)
MSTSTVTMPRRELAAALSRLNATAPRKSPKEILQFARLSFSDRFELAATDIERQHTERVNVYSATGDAAAVIMLANVAELAKAAALSKAAEIELQFNGENVFVDGLRLSPPPGSVDEFPSIQHGFTSEFETIGGAIVDAAEFAALLALSKFAVDTDNSRYALGGVRLECSPGSLGGVRLIATDGRRLSALETLQRVEQYGKPAEPGEPSPVIEPVFALWPAAAAELAARQLAKAAKAKTVVVELLRGYRQPRFASPTEPGAAPQPLPIDPAADMVRLATFDGDGNALSIVTTRCMEGRFPNWRQVLPAERTYRATIATAELANVASRSAAITTADERGAEFSFRQRFAMVKTRSTTGRQVRDALRFAGSDRLSEPGGVRLKLDARFVAELAKAANVAGLSTVDVFASSSTTPAVIELGNRGYHIIMPMARDNGRQAAADKRKQRAKRIDAENQAKAAAELERAELATLNGEPVAA